MLAKLDSQVTIHPSSTLLLQARCSDRLKKCIRKRIFYDLSKHLIDKKSFSALGAFLSEASDSPMARDAKALDIIGSIFDSASII